MKTPKDYFEDNLVFIRSRLKDISLDSNYKFQYYDGNAGIPPLGLLIEQLIWEVIEKVVEDNND